MTEKKVQCPECDAVFRIDLPEAQPGDLTPVTKKDIEEILTREAPDLAHRHKTADEFLDCPECRLWFDKTAQHYQVTEKEPPPETPPPAEKPEDQPGEGKEEPEEKEPEPVAAKSPALGSVFSTKTGGEHGRD